MFLMKDYSSTKPQISSIQQHKMMPDASQYEVDLSAFNFLHYHQHPHEASLHLSRLHSSFTKEKSKSKKAKIQTKIFAIKISPKV